jgi:hypothetical protein
MNNMTRLERVKLMHDNFSTVQNSLRKWGATDTEPDYVYQNAVRRAINGKPFILVDGTDNPWQLYSSVKGYQRANKILTTACRKVARVIDGALNKDMPLIRDWAYQNMHRVDIDFCP